MSSRVQRFVARVKPTRDHPCYFEWQTATVCLFVGEDDRPKAQARAEAELRRRQWQRISFTERATLIEDRVRREGGPVLEAYLRAKAGEPFVLEELDEIAFVTKKSGPSIVAPRLTEAFVDRVVLAAGGERLDSGESGPNLPKTADYRIGGSILELKDLQTEGLEVRTRQERLARLFTSKLRPDRSVLIDPALLSVEETRAFVDIVGRPIRKRLTEAGQQVRATLNRLAEQRMRGGVILLNTGYGSVPPELLYSIASDYVARSATVSVVVCISAWTVTNGLDTVVNFAFSPVEGGQRDVVALRNAFWSEVDTLMTEWARGGFGAPEAAADPLRPIVFEQGDSVFAHLAPKPPSSVGKVGPKDA